MTIATIREFMTPTPVCIAPDLPLTEARARMHELDARHLPVVEGGHLVGIISDRDVALVDAVLGNPEKITVRQAMTAQPFTCGPGAHLHAVAAEMAEHRYGSAVVVDPSHATQVLGVFTTTDALRALAKLTGHG
ncbi:MAG: CBS domain-containing protein [Myxococcales bacterium]|nr:CBS domain-containing protein [Myxococcales bacterium]